MEKEKDLRFNFIFKNVSEKEVGKERERKGEIIHLSVYPSAASFFKCPQEPGLSQGILELHLDLPHE